MISNNSLFYKVYMVVNLVAILLLLFVLVWTTFDIHNRIGWFMIAQVPPIAMMAIRRIIFK